MNNNNIQSTRAREGEGRFHIYIYMFDGTIKFLQLYFEIEQELVGTFAYCFFLQVLLNVIGCRLTYEGQAETNA